MTAIQLLTDRLLDAGDPLLPRGLSDGDYIALAVAALGQAGVTSAGLREIVMLLRRDGYASLNQESGS